MESCVFERHVERLTNAERGGSQETSGGGKYSPEKSLRTGVWG